MARGDPIADVICDAGPLIHLDELGCFDLLRDFPVRLVPDSVWQETKRHRPSALRHRTVSLERCSSLPEADPQVSHFAQAFSLAAGEIAALRLIQESPEAILLTDDAAARLVAERLAYEVHGTIGVVVRALRRKQRTEASAQSAAINPPAKHVVH